MHALARCRLPALVVGLGLTVGACAHTPGTPPPTDDLGDGRSGRIGIASTSPYDFVDMIRGDAPAQVVWGELILPPGDGPVRATAILSHGAGGTGARQDRMAARLAEQGIAALVLDHFGPRDIASTVRDQIRITAQTMLADIVAARAVLETHPRLAGRSVGVIGWSKGGIVATLAAVERFSGYATGGGAPLDFAVAFYPFCGFDLDAERLSSPLLMLLASDDDWTPPGPCLRQAEAWAGSAQPVETEVFEGAAHGFDAWTLFDIPISSAITVRDTSPACTLTVDDAGRTVSVDGSGQAGTIEGRQEFLARCGVRGVTFGGSSRARAAAFARLDAFLSKVLAGAG